jgi:predicted phage terminase large subunit-like protein
MANSTKFKSEQAQIELLRRNAWRDFYVFAKFVCGLSLMEEVPHRELCEFMTLGLNKSEILNIKDLYAPQHPYIKTLDGTLKKLILLPRNSFKSSVADAFVVWLLWRNQNLRIMIDSETLINAKLYLAGIKDMIENNRLLRTICINEEGEYLLEPNKKLVGGFVEDQIILKHRAKVGLKEPSVFCSGVDNAKTGMHPDVIIMDDLVSERNVTTDAQLVKVEEHYKYSLSLLEVGGSLLLVIGTRYHLADLYGQLIRSKTLDTLVRPAENEDGELYFPTRLTREFLQNMRKEQGNYIFRCQYQLNPISQEDAMFKKKYLQYTEDLPEKPKIVARYITVDPAISLGERADYTAIMQVGVDKEKRRYVETYVHKRMLPNDIIDEIFKMYSEATLVKKVGIESVAYQKMLFYTVKDEMRRRGIYMPLVELKADKKKDRRAAMIQPAWENGDIYMSYEHKELEKELLEFPFNSDHDDLVDALAYTEQLLKPVQAKHKKREYQYKPANKVTNY